jgi:hypothetical protein
MENAARQQMRRNPWKVATVGIAALITTALVTGLVVSNWVRGADNVMQVSRPAPATSGGAARNETGIRSNRAVSRNHATTDVLEKAVIGGAVDAGVEPGGGTEPGKDAAIDGAIGGTAGTPDALQEK